MPKRDDGRCRRYHMAARHASQSTHPTPSPIADTNPATRVTALLRFLAECDDRGGDAYEAGYHQEPDPAEIPRA